MSSNELFYVDAVHIGSEFASNASRYQKIVGFNGNRKTYGECAHRCSRELFFL